MLFLPRAGRRTVAVEPYVFFLQNRRRAVQVDDLLP